MCRFIKCVFQTNVNASNTLAMKHLESILPYLWMRFPGPYKCIHVYASIQNINLWPCDGALRSHRAILIVCSCVCVRGRLREIYIYIYQFHILFVHTFEISESIYIDKTCMQAEFLIESDLDTSSFCRHVLREPRHTPALEQTPGIPKPPNENICSWTLGYNTTFFLGW